MKLVISSGKDPYYYGQIGIRNGKSTTTYNEKYFGRHSELVAQGHPDPKAYCLAEIAKYNAEAKANRKKTAVLRINFSDKVDYVENEVGDSLSQNVGYLYLQYILKDLRLKQFMDKHYKDYNFEFNPYDIMRFLIYDRILLPESKLAFSKRLKNFVECPDFKYHDILRCMDVFVDPKNGGEQALLEWCFKKSLNIVTRDFTSIYYDCTNIYFEIERADQVIVDPYTGEIIEYGLRNYGVSKEHRPTPIVQIGMFTDALGIPITYCVEPGNTAECTTAIPLEEDVCMMLNDAADVTYCADAGLGTYSIRKYNSMGGRHFIVTQSIKELAKVYKEAVFNDYDYRLLSTNARVKIKDMEGFDTSDPQYKDMYEDVAYKVIAADNICDLGAYDLEMDEHGKYKKDENGEYIKVKKKEKIHQYLIVTFSRKLRDYQRAIRNGQIERAKQLISTSKNPLDIKKSPNDVKRFIKTVTKNARGETLQTSCVLDDKRIQEEEKYDGYCCIATNFECTGIHATENVRKALHISKGRYKIESCFRVLKTNLNCRPVYHQNRNRIKAHCLLCFLALLVQRLLEVKLDQMGKHATTEALIKSMQVMNVTEIGPMYKSIFTGGNVMKSLEEMSGLELDMLYYKRSDLNRRIRKVLT